MNKLAQEHLKQTIWIIQILQILAIKNKNHLSNKKFNDQTKKN